jgi:hypothetical protein
VSVRNHAFQPSSKSSVPYAPLKLPLGWSRQNVEVPVLGNGKKVRHKSLTPEQLTASKRYAEQAIARLADYKVSAFTDVTGMHYGRQRHVSFNELRRYVILLRDKQGAVELLPRATVREVQQTLGLIGIDETGLPVREQVITTLDLDT